MLVEIFVLKIGSEFMAVDGYVDVESNNISRRFLHSYYKPSSRSVFMFKPSQRSRHLFRTNDRRVLKQNIESQLTLLYIRRTEEGKGGGLLLSSLLLKVSEIS